MLVRRAFEALSLIGSRRISQSKGLQDRFFSHWEAMPELRAFSLPPSGMNLAIRVGVVMLLVVRELLLYPFVVGSVLKVVQSSDLVRTR